MDTFNLEFETDSTLNNDTNSNSSDLDWTAFQSVSPILTQSPFSPSWLSQTDDAVAPINRSNVTATEQDNGAYFEFEHIFNGLNQQQHQLQSPSEQGIIEPVQTNINLSDHIINTVNPIESTHHIYPSSNFNERPTTCLPEPLVPRVLSTRSHCYHKLPDHAVKLMQEWYNANLDDPYPRSPDKKRFITEGNITAQQCRSWFANRRQRLKHVKRNQPRASTSRSHQALQNLSCQSLPSTSTQSQILAKEASKVPFEHCYYCQQQQQHHQQQQQPSQQITSLPFQLTPSSATSMTTTTTTLNVVINQQTIEQLIHDGLRKLLYQGIM